MNKLAKDIQGFNVIESSKGINIIQGKKIDFSQEDMDTTLQEFNSLLNSLDYIKINGKEISISTNDEFISHQYNIMFGNYVVIHYVDKSTLRVVTREGKCYII